MIQVALAHEIYLTDPAFEPHHNRCCALDRPLEDYFHFDAASETRKTRFARAS